MVDSSKHTASRVIIAPARSIFRAFMDPESVASWRAPKGMTGKVLAFDARVGGSYRMAFYYPESKRGRSKTSPDADYFEGRFVDLLPDEKIVETVEFESNDPAFAGTMTITTTLAPVTGGTKVTFLAENAPAGISAAEHKAGMDSTLKNLANFIE